MAGDESMAPQQLRAPMLIQDGDDTKCSSTIKGERFPYINQPSRCIPTHPYSSFFEKVSAISMARKVIPVQGTTLQSIASSLDIHEDVETIVMMGMVSRNQDISILGRFNHCSRNQGAVQEAHQNGSREARKPRFSDKGIQVQLESIPDDPTSGI